MSSFIKPEKREDRARSVEAIQRRGGGGVPEKGSHFSHITGLRCKSSFSWDGQYFKKRWAKGKERDREREKIETNFI